MVVSPPGDASAWISTTFVKMGAKLETNLKDKMSWGREISFHKLDKYISLFWQIYLSIKTDKFWCFDKYISKSRQIPILKWLWERGYNWFRQAEENFWKPTRPDEAVQRWISTTFWSKMHIHILLLKCLTKNIPSWRWPWNLSL